MFVVGVYFEFLFSFSCENFVSLVGQSDFIDGELFFEYGLFVFGFRGFESGVFHGLDDGL